MPWKQPLKCVLVLVPLFVLAIFSGSIYEDLRNRYDIVEPSWVILKTGQGILAATVSCTFLISLKSVDKELLASTFTSQSILALIWNFFEFWPSFHICTGGVFLFVSFVDFIIGFLLLLATGLQSTYLPHTLSGCHDAFSWRVQGNGTNFFSFVAHQDPRYTPDAVCQNYMNTWIMGIVLGVVSLLSSYSAMKEAKNPPPDRNGRRSRGVDFVGWLISLIPRFLTTPIKYSVLWLRKWGRRWSRPGIPNAGMRMLTLQTHIHPLDVAPTSQDKSNPKFLELLSSYPIMTAIAKGLHYADLIQLSLVSKEVHEIIFPHSKNKASSSIKKHCCLKGVRAACWCCKTQICSAKDLRYVDFDSNDVSRKAFCATTCYIAQAKTTGHLRHCTQYCSSCFRTRLCNSAGPRELSPRCRCDVGLGGRIQQLCRFCIKLADNVARERVEKKEHEEILAKAARQVNCGGCSKKLPKTGPRWWACKRCWKECRSEYHPQWAESAEV